MKKFAWIAALFAALALLFTGCGDGVDDTGEQEKDKGAKGWFLATDEDKTQAPDNKKTLTDEDDGYAFAHIYFNAPNADFSKIKISFTLSQSSEIIWQCAYAPNGTWGNGYAAAAVNNGSIETDPAVTFNQKWSDQGDSVKFDKKAMDGICLKIKVPETGDKVFTLTGVTFLAPEVIVGGDIDLTEIFTNTEDNDGVPVTIGKNSFSWEGTESGQLVTPKETPWDISGYKGFKFSYKSSANATFFIMDADSDGGYVGIFSSDGTNDGWGAINVAGDWEEITLPFTYIKRAWGNKDTDQSKIYKIWFDVGSPPEQKRFEVKDFTCY